MRQFKRYLLLFYLDYHAFLVVLTRVIFTCDGETISDLSAVLLDVGNVIVNCAEYVIFATKVQSKFC